jgi:hypothetical protein
MVCVQAVNEMKKYWGENRERLLGEHSEGYLVINFYPARHFHFSTKEQIYKKFPLLEGKVKGILTATTLPMIIDVLEEQFLVMGRR